MSKSKKKLPSRPEGALDRLPACPEFERAPGAPFPPAVRKHALLVTVR
jgi:hypothetical protein